MILYRDMEVLDIRPSRDGDVEEQLARPTLILDAKMGPVTVVDTAPAPLSTRSFMLKCFNRAAVATVRAFLDRRRGRAVPFWMPTYQSDVVLAADAALNAPALSILWFGYTQSMYPSTNANRHLVLYGPTLNFSFHKVTAATDPGTGATETLSIDPIAPRAFPAASTLVSFLRLFRLEEDYTEIRWRSGTVAEVELRVVEVPNEVPA